MVSHVFWVENSLHIVGFGIFVVLCPEVCRSGGSKDRETPAVIVGMTDQFNWKEKKMLYEGTAPGYVTG